MSWFGSLMACAAVQMPSPAVARPDTPRTASVDSSGDSAGVCAPTPASVAARFSHFSPLGPVALGGVVARVRGGKTAIESVLRDVDIRKAVMHPCPGDVTLVWIAGGTSRVAEALGHQGLQVDETIVLSAADGHAFQECIERKGAQCRGAGAPVPSQ
jgi:hypothetical protein